MQAFAQGARRRRAASPLERRRRRVYVSYNGQARLYRNHIAPPAHRWREGKRQKAKTKGKSDG